MRDLPTLFVSHGGPDILLEGSPARDFLAGYAAALPRPAAILVVSAHYETAQPALTADARPAMIYDFSGFPEPLYEMVYRAPGAPALAARVAALLDAAALPARLERGRGFDHGAWVPLMLLYPAADIPVIELSVQTALGAAHHLAVGRALAGLRREGVLVVGSGSMTHNLREYFGGGHGENAPVPDWVSEFAAWTGARIEAGAADELAAYRALAPHAARNHPTEEHFLPLFVALGAAGPGAKGRRVHASAQRAVLRMDAYAFGSDTT